MTVKDTVFTAAQADPDIAKAVTAGWGTATLNQLIDGVAAEIVSYCAWYQFPDDLQGVCVGGGFGLH